jgi:Rho GDP-dissociation inhibitor
VAEGHPWGPLKIVPGSKENKLTLKEGCKYHLRLTFLVRYDIVVCLKMVNNVWRGPLKVATQEEMIGSFAPLATQHVVNLEDERAPEGFLGRGDYNGKVVILDKEGTVHLQY